MKLIASLIFAGLLLVGCSKESVKLDDLQVSTSTLTYKAGDTVTFQLDGNPDNITFYSGEPGAKYEFRNRTSADNDLRIQFKSLVQFGLIYQNLKLLVSNNFDGKADSNSIKAATWTDISSLATFSAGADSVPSGVISLKPYANTQNPASPIYVAFKYTDYKKTQGQNRWVIRTFNADNVAPDGLVTPLATMSTGGWQQVNFQNAAAVWSISTAQLLMAGGSATSADNEDWVFSKGFDITYVKPDVGIALKNIAETLTTYKYAYKKPGTYTAVFEYSAVRYNGEKRGTREITFTITP
jgi:hypothetical protein